MNNREEQIKHATSEYTKGIIEDSTIRAMDFENGAKWADNNPKFINIEQKEIIIPQGWEIDKVDDNKIILKKSKKELPKTWEECYKLLGRGEFINDFCYICGYTCNEAGVNEKNILPTGLGKPMLALCQLLVCREIYRQGWKPDWTNRKENKYCIINEINKINKIAKITYFTSKVLSFQSEEVRDEFLENFKDLIEEAKELI